MHSLRLAARHLISRNKSPKQSPSVPDRPANNDLYIVEFPKSGITWLCTLITNYCLLVSGSGLRATHFNLEHFIGDVQQASYLIGHPAFSGLRLIKSHSNYNPAYRHVFYLIRNPQSVMLSYFHFTVGRGEFTGSFTEFLEHPRFGIDAWVRHVESWLSPPRQFKLQLVRYEDLKADTSHALAHLLRSMGFDTDPRLLEAAIARSEFAEMRKDADHYREHCPFRHYDFVREGRSKAELGTRERNLICSRAHEILTRLYPDG